MCGRFVSTQTPAQVGEYFDAIPTVESLGENYNVAPTHDVYGVVAAPTGGGRSGSDGSSGATVERRVEAFHWGLIPSWAKDRKIASRMINARSETLAEKNAFKGLFAKKRLLVPMDGFYEWKAGHEGGPVNSKGKPLKQPMFIHRTDGEPLAVAGLWTAWKDPDPPAEADPSETGDAWLHSATIITTAANATMSAIHDRMPVVVPRSRWDEWLDPDNHDIESLSSIFDVGDVSLTMHEVSTDVNNVRNNDAHLVDAV